MATDAKASGRWSTNGGGEYYAVGVGGALAGRGADLAIIDDPVSEQDALSVTALDNIYEWYTSGPRQRLQPGGAIIIVMTRWSIRDLTAKVWQSRVKRALISGILLSFLRLCRLVIRFGLSIGAWMSLRALRRLFLLQVECSVYAEPYC